MHWGCLQSGPVAFAKSSTPSVSLGRECIHVSDLWARWAFSTEADWSGTCWTVPRPAPSTGWSMPSSLRTVLVRVKACFSPSVACNGSQSSSSNNWPYCIVMFPSWSNVQRNNRQPNVNFLVQQYHTLSSQHVFTVSWQCHESST